MLYVYIGCLTFGIIYSAVSAILGAHGFDHGAADHGGMDGHSGADSADMPSPFNPLVIASAVATFGGVGVIGKAGFRMGDLTSAVIALAFAGGIGAAIFFGIIKFMYGSQSDSTFSLADLIGLEAEVITSIPENGMGEIAYTFNGMRNSLPARTSGGEKITRGSVVRIKDISGNIALVTQKMTLDEYERLETDHGQSQKKEENNSI